MNFDDVEHLLIAMEKDILTAQQNINRLKDYMKILKNNVSKNYLRFEK